MKKFLFMLSAVLLMAVGTTLTSCKHSKTAAPPDIAVSPAIIPYGTTITDAALNVENILDAKDADGTIAGVSNVFYVVNQLDGSYDSFAQLIAHILHHRGETWHLGRRLSTQRHAHQPHL